MSRIYALRFFAFGHQQRIVPLPMEDGEIKFEPKMPEIHIWGVLLRKLYKTINNSLWSEKLIWPTNNQPQIGKETESIIILFVPTSALTSTQFFRELINDFDGLRRIEAISGVIKGDRNLNYQPSPIITVSLENAMALYEESANLDCDPNDSISWIEKRQKNSRLYRLGIDHRVKFLDTSIWHRYVACNKNFKENLLARLSDLVSYSDLRLYRSLASLASLEFQCRMLLNSFIVPYGANGHHEAVTPFKFHSETSMAEQSERILQFLRGQGEEMQLIDLHWNSLIVDDHAVEAISTIADNLSAPLPGTDEQPSIVSDNDASEKPPSKRELIARWLNQERPGMAGKLLNVQTENYTKGDTGIINQGIQILEGQTCDVIFLDYLLGKGDTLHTNGREYGHEFLLELATGKRNLHRGPLGRYWIFPISSFPFAFSDKLRQLGMEGVSDQWYISEGGDPITTPEMFRFNFLRMVLLQISKFYLYPSAMIRMLERFSNIIDRKEWGGALRTAIEVRESNQKQLAADQTLGSVLARSVRSFLKKQKRYDLQIQYLKKLAIQLERPLNAARYRMIWEIQTELKKNIHEHPAANVTDEKIIALLAEINKKQKEVEKKIKEAGRKKSTYLDLSDFGMLDLPFMISRCTHLEHLNLSGNRIDFIPKEISDLTRLVRLDLSGNDFCKLPDALMNLPALEWLDLRDNPQLGALADVYEGENDIKGRLFKDSK